MKEEKGQADYDFYYYLKFKKKSNILHGIIKEIIQ